MEAYQREEEIRDSARPAARLLLIVAAVVLSLVAVSLFGSLRWRPALSTGKALPLGKADPVSFPVGSAEETFSRVLEVVGPTVAFIMVQDEDGSGRSGSGVVVHEAGFVVTNAHVVEGVREVRVVLGDGLEFSADVYGVDSATDLAVVKLHSDAPVPVAALGDSDQLRVGEFVLAVGAPFSFRGSATSGIVSGLHQTGLGIARYEDFIVTDAPINRGNSGGPLVNLRGEVVGINTAIIAADGPEHAGFSGVGFAIPVNVVKAVAERLIGDGGFPATDGSGSGFGADGSSGFATRQTPAPRAPGASLVSFDQQSAREIAPGVAHLQILDGTGSELRTGSGFLVETDDRPILITNYHVIEGATTIQIHLDESPPLEGEVIFWDQSIDLAIVGFDSAAPLQFFKLAESGPAAGDAITAVGSLRPGGVQRSSGVVTGLDVTGTGMAPDAGLIETTASVAKGFSGGPLLDQRGLVVGVILGGRAAAETSDGKPRSYAVPIDAIPPARLTASASAEEKSFDAGFLAWPHSGAAARSLGAEKDAIVVLDVNPGTPAERAGLNGGDAIVAVDGEPLADARAWIRDVLRMLAPGEEVTLTVTRPTVDGQRQRIPILLRREGGERSDSDPAAVTRPAGDSQHVACASSLAARPRP